MRQETEKLPQRFHEALAMDFHAGQGCGRTARFLAAQEDVHPSTIYEIMSGERTITVQRYESLAKELPTANALQYLARLQGHVVAPLPCPDELTTAGMADTLQEVADLTRVYANTIDETGAGGCRTTRAEADRIQKEGWEVIYAVYRLMVHADMEASQNFPVHRLERRRAGNDS